MDELKEFNEAVKQLCRDFSSRTGNVYIKDVISALDTLLEQYEPPVTKEEVERLRAEFEALAGPLGYDLTRAYLTRANKHGLSEAYTKTETYRASRLHEEAQMLWEKRYQGDMAERFRALGDLFKALGVPNMVQALAKIDRLKRTNPYAHSKFRMGQRVKKVTGDYKIRGVVRSVFVKGDGAVRLVVEHTAEGGGSFLHIYGEANLEADDD